MLSSSLELQTVYLSDIFLRDGSMVQEFQILVWAQSKFIWNQIEKWKVIVIVISVIKMPNVTEALSLLRGENFLFLLLLYVN